jgi:hypothetical protein
MRHKYDGFLMLQLNVPHCHTPRSQSPAYALLFLLFAWNMTIAPALYPYAYNPRRQYALLEDREALLLIRCRRVLVGRNQFHHFSRLP